MNNKFFNIVLFISLLFMQLACLNKEHPQAVGETDHHQANQDGLGLVLSMDTLRSAALKKFIFHQDSIYRSRKNFNQNPYYHYFHGRKFELQKKKDSAQLEYELMTASKPSDEVALLKNLTLLSRRLSYGSIIEAGLMNQILNGLKLAEERRSKLTYAYYDLIARAFFQNHNEKRSLEYAAKYYQAHPFQQHPVIKQRYFDISFLLASRLDDLSKMSFYNNQARILAIKLKDSLALARTYDNQGQIYSKQMQTGKALECSKIYFSYLKKTDNLNDIAFNNLATAFVRNGNADSAIMYYKEGIRMEKQDPSGKRKIVHYQGLIDAYKLKGDYQAALEAADSVYAINTRNNKAIEAEKVAEMHEKYETEKKDRSISELNNRNKLNEKLINQQRWLLFMVLIIFLSAISLFIVSYRQLRLNDKNKLLAADNQRLVMEQKLLQAQLNPHFIFNAIANLQGLIATGQTSESVRYLKSFSGLLRAILEQNRKDFITIEEEISSLHHYLLLQQMRYADTFTYQISVSEDIDEQSLLIPPMLIQPFVENSIEHGFRNIPYKGLLHISFHQQNDQLEITVDDNGCGLGNKSPGDTQKQSLAKTILTERFAGLFSSYNQKANFTLTDKNKPGESGALVKINIPFIND